MAWVPCNGCDGTGDNPVEGTCLICGGNGSVFKECANPECPDCGKPEKSTKPTEGEA